jgi:glycosyl hydrolase family 10
MKRFCTVYVAAVCMCLLASPSLARDRWTPEQARRWQSNLPWLVGSNFAPASAINQLEMWQPETFDPQEIDRELGWAEGLGFNSMRVFLHHLPYEADPEGFLKRVDQFLSISDKHHIGAVLVLFDSVWDPNPKLGKQHEPVKGVHNSGWVQSPGAHDLFDSSRHKVLESYVKGVIGRFKNDKRVHAWDIWNEPDNLNSNSYGKEKLNIEPAGKQEKTLELLKQAFNWARSVDPSQPITSAPWMSTWADPSKLSPTEKVQFDESDVISFHAYDTPDVLLEKIHNLNKFNRPILCTEYMARPRGSTFDPELKLLKDQHVAAYNWGFVAGKTNTIYPWDSWQKTYDSEPKVWFHDIFRQDGTPFDQKEVEYIRSVTGKK